MALFGWENAVDAAGGTLAVSAALAGFGPEMLRVPIGSPAVAWQTPAGALSASLTINLPAAVAWKAACLARTNLTTDATLRVRVGAPATLISAPAYDSGAVSAGVAWGIGQALHILPAAVSALVMRIDLADPANPDGFLSVPLVFAGPCRDSPLAPQSSSGLDVRRADTTTRGGQVLTTPLSRARSYQITVSDTPDATGSWLDALEAAAAAGRNILFVPRPANARAPAEAILGLLASGRRGFVSRVGDTRNWSATISERL